MSSSVGEQKAFVPHASPSRAGRFVIKRTGERQKWSFDKITTRIERLCVGLSQVEPELITQTVASSIRNNMTTSQIDVLTAEIADNLMHVHPQYRELAGRILVSNNHKNTPECFSEAMEVLHDNVDRKGRRYGLFSEPFMRFVRENAKQLDAAIVHANDFRLNYVQFRTFEDTYVLKKRVMCTGPDGRRVEERRVYERPQYVWMREAIQVNGYADVERVIRVYTNISNGRYTHATPTILNSGFIYNTCISCYLDIVRDDSLDAIYDLLKRCAKHSQGAGGIGFDVSNVRASGAEIRSSGGSSNGLVPMLKNFNETANYVDQCFHPSTRVLTAEGFRTIDSVQENDRVLTLDGSFQPVTRVLTNVVRGGAPLIRLHLSTGNLDASVFMTRNHPFLALHNRGALPHAELLAQLDSGRLKSEFVASEELLVGDYVCIPVPQLAYPQEAYGTDDLELFAMLILGEFVISEDFSVLHYIRQSGADVAEFLQRYIRKNYLEHDVSAEHVKIFVTHRFKFTKAMLFDARGEMYVHARMLHAGLDQVEVLMKAITKLRGFQPTVRSLAVAEAVYYWALRLGVLVDFEAANKLSRGGSKYVVRMPGNFWDLSRAPTYSSRHHFKHGDRFYSQITSIEEAHHQGAVYDLEVNKNKNYATELGLVHNGGGKRKGSFAVYLEPWHADILKVIAAMGVQGDERNLTRDLFFAIWMNDLFMERLERGEMWSLMCPDSCPGLFKVYGEEFRRMYLEYEAKGMYTEQISAKELYMRIVKLQIERGRPYIVFKDWSNETSNQKNIGIIRSSNLCAEILEVANERYTACCNLASIALPTFVRNGAFDFEGLAEIAGEATVNLNNIIDFNNYMTADSEAANRDTRPIALGVQGLADVFAMLGLPFDSPEAVALDRKIYEHIYFGALRASVSLARRDGPYAYFEGSPFSKGILQFDHYPNVPLSQELDWDGLKEEIKQFGTRNSLLTASMPTASTAILLGNSEGFEPYPSMLVTKSNKTGRFSLLNKNFVECMEARGLWSEDVYNRVKEADGYVSKLECVPEDLRRVFAGAYEIPQRSILDHAAARQPFLDQTQSMNLFFSRSRIAQSIAQSGSRKTPDEVLVERMNICLMYAWKNRLKTAVYYTRTEAATTAQKRTSAPTARTASRTASRTAAPAEQVVCTDDVCTSCSA